MDIINEAQTPEHRNEPKIHYSFFKEYVKRKQMRPQHWPIRSGMEIHCTLRGCPTLGFKSVVTFPHASGTGTGEFSKLAVHILGKLHKEGSKMSKSNGKLELSPGEAFVMHIFWYKTSLFHTERNTKNKMKAKELTMSKCFCVVARDTTNYGICEEYGEKTLIKPQDILATLQSIPEDESESELQEHVFDSDSDEDFIPQNISSESEDSEGTNPEDIPSTSTGDQAHAVMLHRDHPPGRGQKKSAKRPRNERTTDNDGGEGNATTNTREGESEGILVSADGIQWKPVEIGEHLPGRRDSQNILREAPGPTGYARRNIIIDSPLSAWRLFFDSYILTHIKNCTLAEACRNNNLQFTLSYEELDAFIAIFYARGISGTNRHSISSIWCNDWGIPFCKATMSRDRFVEIMRFLRFDEKSTRSERLQTDKFALFSTVWDRFIENCIACYKPGPYITVDEQLFPSKTRCPFTQYMPSKPDKYGHKYWLAVDKRSKYLANGFPYLGKDDTRRAEDRLADHVVMKLLDPFLKKGRNVTTDNYFTSVKLAKQLKSKGTTIVGTLNKIRREVPKEIKSMKEELYNTKVFRNEDNFTLTVYQGKPKKMLSF
ncbi:uncharacterized protein [Phyllobates terribilis]|uniref:uncharacterized protein n=1 Tax=Phyllobates terribilis TaxID=111132 RepID=UPI003CCB24FA